MSYKMDVTYTCGVIAAREKYLLKDRIFRLCELSAEEAFRLLLESGFGGGADTTASVYEYEKLIAVEEEKLDAFIREYAPSQAEKAYFLAPRDFHNAKALVKAAYLGENEERMLAGEGLIGIETLRSCVASGDFTPIEEVSPELKDACEAATALLREEPSGAKLGAIFEKALYAYLGTLAKHKKVLKNLLTAKADMTNILTALRAGDMETAKDKFLPAGKLTEKELEKLFLEDGERAVKEFSKTPYAEFVRVCFEAKEKRLPLTEAEKIRDSYDGAYFSARRYDLERSEPFLYYVYRLKAENTNVRIVFACLLAGLGEQDVKRRLRVF